MEKQMKQRFDMRNAYILLASIALTLLLAASGLAGAEKGSSLRIINNSPGLLIVYSSPAGKEQWDQDGSCIMPGYAYSITFDPGETIVDLRFETIAAPQGRIETRVLGVDLGEYPELRFFRDGEIEVRDKSAAAQIQPPGPWQNRTGNPYTNSIGMEFALIPAGSFMMGTDPKIEKGRDNETPQHKVTISRPFYLGKYEVTQAQWETVMGTDPSEFKGRDNPVENVSWLDVQEFIARLNQMEGHAGYRLPTEAEWEYAARAGTSGPYYSSGPYFSDDDRDKLSKHEWYDANSKGMTHPVGQKFASAWGLHDMHGNVKEWVEDRYEAEYYANSPEVDPKGPANGSSRVFRGGFWNRSAEDCRPGLRLWRRPDYYDGGLGFRLALSLE